MLSRIKDRLDGAANPIMVKEMYQSLHSKFFMAFFWLLLVLALFIYYVGGGSENEAAGDTMFSGFMVIMGLVMLLVIPIGAFYALYRDVTSRTIELVQITAMNARQLVRGRLMAAGMRIVLLLSLVAPFAVTSYLFGGLDLTSVLMVVYNLLLVSLGAVAVALFLSSLAVYRHLRMLAVLAFGAIILLGLLSGLGAIPGLFMFGAAGFFGSGPGWADVLTLLAGGTVMTALGIMLLSSATANSLTFPGNRSSARTKLIALFIVVAQFGSLLMMHAVTGSGFPADPMMFAMMACPFLGVCCLFWLTGDTRVPYRHQVWMERRGRLGRLAYLPFRDGAFSTAVYVVLAMALVGAGALVLIGVDRWPPVRSHVPIVYPIVLTLTYALYLSALAWGAVSLLPARLRTSLRRRAALLLLLILSAGVMLASMAGHWELRREMPAAATAFVPVLYIVSLYRLPSLTAFLLHMAGPLAVGLAGHAVIGIAERRRKSRSAEATGRQERAAPAADGPGG
jgi:hypothetical protein